MKLEFRGNITREIHLRVIRRKGLDEVETLVLLNDLAVPQL